MFLPLDRTLIIAEAGINHDGDIAAAKKMVDVAVRAGADYVKFQSFVAEKLALPVAERSTYIVEGSHEGESFRDLLKRLELRYDEQREMNAYCKAAGIKFLSTAFDRTSLDLLCDELGCDIIKIASADLTNLRFLRYAAGKDLPIVLSTGMADLPEIDEALDALQDAATLTPAQIESEIQQALTQLQTAEDTLPVVDQPDVQYYEQQVQQAENALEQLQHSTTIVGIGALTDAVDSAEDRVDDEKEFLDKVEKAVEGCQVDVETDTHTKLEFNQKLTYRNETYETGTVYDVQNWIADVLLADYATTVSKATSTCDAERDITIDGHTGSLADAQDDYNDVVTQYDEAVVQLEKAHLQNQKSIRAAQMDLARAQRNLEWAQSGQYSREGILAAAGQSADDPAPPQSVSLAQQQLQADITLAKAQLDDARKRLSELQGGIDPDEKELAEAQLAQAQAHAAYAETQAEQIELRVKQAELALQVARVQHESATVALDVARAQHESAAVAVDVARVQHESAAVAMDSSRAQELSTQTIREAAEADLARNELRAPWSGSIAALPLKMDAYVQPGQPVATLADFSGWKVETDNLTEIEVPEVTLGQKVSITPDALPELELPGVVTDISALHAEKRGDVTYTVTVAMEKSDPRLRWGMTMVVTFPLAD